MILGWLLQFYYGLSDVEFFVYPLPYYYNVRNYATGLAAKTHDCPFHVHVRAEVGEYFNEIRPVRYSGQHVSEKKVNQ